MLARVLPIAACFLALCLTGCARESSLSYVESVRSKFLAPRTMTEKERAKFVVEFQIPAGAQGPALLFGTLEAEHSDERSSDFELVIVQAAAREWTVSQADLFGFWWQGVAFTQDRKHIWAVAQYDVEDPDWELHLYHSDDVGRTWEHWAAIKKPYYVSEFDGIEFAEDGSGQLWINAEETDAIPPGTYVFTTRDWGRHWTAPARIISEEAMPPEPAPVQEASGKSIKHLRDPYLNPVARSE